MTPEQIKTAMATAWLECELEADKVGQVLTERDKLMWQVGYAAGALMLCDHVREQMEIAK